MSELTPEEQLELERLRLEERKRQLFDDTRASVERGLFRTYRNNLALVLTTLGAVGIVVGWPTLQGYIDRTVVTQINARVSAIADEPIKRAKESAENARLVSQKVEGQMEIQSENLSHAYGKLLDRLETVNTNYSRANSRLGLLQIDLKSIDEKTKEIKELSTFFKERAQLDPITKEDIASIEKRIAELAEQTSKLSAAMASIATAPDNKAKLTQIGTGLSKIAGQTVKDPQAGDFRARTIAYVQFAGGQRDTIKKLTQVLKQSGWAIPGEERTPAAASQHEVRYFHDEDLPAAKALADETHATAESLGLGIPLVDAKKTVLARLPKIGIIELWLQVP